MEHTPYYQGLQTSEVRPSADFLYVASGAIVDTRFPGKVRPFAVAQVWQKDSGGILSIHIRRRAS